MRGLLALLLGALGCVPRPNQHIKQPQPPEPLQGVVWVDRVLGFSSEWSPTQWGAWSVVGAPDVYPFYKDDPLAWAAYLDDSVTPEWLEVGFARDVEASEILIVETFNPGGVVRIEEISDPTAPQLLWAGYSKPASYEKSSLTRFPLKSKRRLRAIRVTLDTRLQSGWEEIDAIGVITLSPTEEEQAALTFLESIHASSPETAVRLNDGNFVLEDSQDETADGEFALRSFQTRGVVWATGVQDYSTQWTDTQWSVSQALGPPNVFPTCGDDERAWAALGEGDGEEFLALVFPSTTADAVVIIETLVPGSVIQIEDTTDPYRPVVLWSSKVTKPKEECRAFEVSFLPRKISALRITLDTSAKPNWEEIDAVGLIPVSANE